MGGTPNEKGREVTRGTETEGGGAGIDTSDFSGAGAAVVVCVNESENGNDFMGGSFALVVSCSIGFTYK